MTLTGLRRLQDFFASSRAPSSKVAKSSAMGSGEVNGNPCTVPYFTISVTAGTTAERRNTHSSLFRAVGASILNPSQGYSTRDQVKSVLLTQGDCRPALPPAIERKGPKLDPTAERRAILEAEAFLLRGSEPALDLRQPFAGMIEPKFGRVNEMKVMPRRSQRL
ncbi:hypothetical protein ARMGADRAFT_1038819 [Armillaria gallica]|uniref:Uncharacterized protein n=1 Tax=Armillaria gallica TaxID=47427 RepID=A0A2H3CGJ5_ARMGA|nr:hypothetical protein ARMGADRAFT_1038819 [Armillaria gallica]